MQKIFNLDKWERVEEGEVISFASDRHRMVRLETNSETASVVLSVVVGDEPIFLAAPGRGRDTIEFAAEGSFDLVVTGGATNIYTADGADWSVEPVDDTTFTKIIERQQRNPEMEYMIAVAAQNMEKRLAAQHEELSRRFEAREARRDAERAAADAAHAAALAAATPAPSGGGQGEQPGALDGGGGLPAAPVAAPAAIGSQPNAGT